MKTEMTTYECAKALTHDKYANWTRSGAFALVEYLEQIEEDCGTSIEFDPVALRCEFSEYESFNEFAKEFWSDDCHLYWATDDVIRNFIQDRTTLIEFDGGLIIQDF
tara:strand:- start:78 stop:398 length:321 start_codon:yes stop_codon:yes gene_type:complete